ncbi:MAG: serine hydrolase domain-containing protein, partial [Pirellula sp.]
MQEVRTLFFSSRLNMSIVCNMRLGCLFLVIGSLQSSCLLGETQPQPYPGKSWQQPEHWSRDLGPSEILEFTKRVGGDGCVVQDGVIIASWGDPNRTGDWASAAKPVLSTLLLLAVQEGKLASLDSKVKDVGWQLSEKDSEMTFRHLANMVSGYACAEPPGAAWGYNDFAIQLYAKSLEKVFGESLEQVIRTRLAALQ